MLGERSDHRGLWEADQLYLDLVGRDSFYGLLATLRGQLFRDADFAELYCLDNVRASVAPSLLATALLLQSHDRVSDAEAKARADFDIRRKVELGIEIEERPCAKGTWQMFRAQLILHDKVREEPAVGAGARLPEAWARDEGDDGHHVHPRIKYGAGSGPGSGEGHLQSAGRRHREADAGSGGGGECVVVAMG